MAEVNARIQAKIELAFGEDLLLIGSVPALGSWDVPKAAALTWSEGGIWSSELSLPCGVRIEMKPIIRSHNGLRWLGAGAAGQENIVLETGLGRQGAQGSRFITEALPIGLSVEDLSFGPPPAAGREEEPERSGGHCPAPGAPGQLVAAGPGGPGQAGPMGQGAAMGGQAADGGAPPPHIAAAMLAGGAAMNTGRAVTYATTTTTTTYVTIGGTPGEGGQMGQPVPQQPGITYGPGGMNGRPMGGPAGGPMGAPPSAGGGGCYPAIADSGVPAALALEDDTEADVTDERHQLVSAARQKNAGITRLGCVMLAWRKTGAQEVLVAGSWDGWSRQLALEPLPQGGFGLVLALAPGEYECKFIVDGEWLASEDIECKGGRYGNNILRAGNSLLMPMDIAAAKEDAANNALAIVVR